MKTNRPKFWDRSERTYEIKWPDGKKELWKDITITDCLTKYNNMGAFELGLEIREIVGKELQMQKVMDKRKKN